MKKEIQKIEKFERDMLNGKNLRITEKKGDTSFKLHWHSYYEIIYYKNCHGTCILNGKSFPVTENCIFFLTPKDFHEIENDKNEDQALINLSFSENIIDKGIIKELSMCPRVVYNPPKELTDIFSLLAGTNRVENKLTSVKALHLLNYILCEIISNGECINATNKYITPEVGDVIAYVISDPARKITLSDAAKKAGMSEAYFSSIFHKETGVTFVRYVNSLRTEQAKRYLENDDMSVLDICFECGFNSISQFIRTFRQFENVSPSEYRKQHRKKSEQSCN